MKVSVVGTGYVGLVTGTCLAESGNDVTCVDIDKAKVKQMQAGQVPIYEPDLDGLFRRNIAESRLHFTDKLSVGIKDAEVIFLALPTPPKDDGSADLSYVLGVADELGGLLKSYTVIVNKSTVPIGSVEKVRTRIAAKAKVDFDVISNPEFLREGFAVSDFMKPDRLVVGTQSEKAKSIMSKLFAPFIRQGNPIFFMDERSAEMTKYAANSFLAMKISFMNEIANLCEAVGANVDSVRLGIGSDERIGRRFLFPGPGYGGSCFPKDVSAIQKIGLENNYELKIMKAVTEVNDRQKTILVTKMRRYFKDKLAGKNVAVWGLAFKADTDDIRESSAIPLVSQLIDAGANVTAYDPEAAKNFERYMTNLNKKMVFASGAYQALEGADCLVIVTDWSEFRTLDSSRAKKLLKGPVIFDGRNLYDPSLMKEAGFYYESIGR